jgi:hypothetical protein
MTLADNIAAATAAVFLNATAGPAVAITLRIGGDPGETLEFDGIVSYLDDPLLQSHLAPDAADSFGQKDLATIVITCARDTVSAQTGDVFEIPGGRLANFVRYGGEDEEGNLLDIICREIRGHYGTTKRPRLRI